eukprot:346880-Chlamydomonas_euryale.AAC.1
MAPWASRGGSDASHPVRPSHISFFPPLFPSLAPCSHPIQRIPRLCTPAVLAGACTPAWRKPVGCECWPFPPPPRSQLHPPAWPTHAAVALLHAVQRHAVQRYAVQRHAVVVGLPDNSPAAELAAKHGVPRPRTAQPPPEVLVVPDGLSLRELRHAAARVLADVYRMFGSKWVGNRTVADREPFFEVDAVVGGLPASVACDGDAGVVAGLPDGHVLMVTVSNINPHHKWRHAGGQEDWV